jgi:hypothetical protein
MQLNNEYLGIDKATYLTLKDLIDDLYVNNTYSITDVEFIRDKLLSYERQQIVDNLRTVVSKVVNELDINVDIDIEIRNKVVDIVFK